jgi:hypothetical protein
LRSWACIRFERRHVEGQHDDRAITLALAASKLIERPVGKGTAVIEWDPITPLTFGGVGVSGTLGYGDMM